MEPPLSTEALLFIVALIACAVFSFLETTVTALRLFKLKELARATGSYESLFHALEKNPDRVLITILIAKNLADVTAAALATHLMEKVFKGLNFSSGIGFSLGIGFATLAILIFGEVIPKNIAKVRGEKIFRSMLWLMNIVYYVLYPVVTFLTKISDFVITKMSSKGALETGTEWVTSEKEIQFLIEHISEKGVMDTEKTEMLQNIFELGSTPVREIMVPATDIISVNAHTTIQDTLALFSKYSFTRLPVYEENVTNIIGMVHQKDIFLILSKNEEKTLQEIVRPIMFIPDGVKVNQLLRELREQHMHIAMVINEYGSITGLITLEDILEEIVGEISDEHEPTSEKIVPLKQGGWLIDASAPLEEVEEELPITFETENALTLGGFLTEQLQHLPKKGERVLYKGFYFQVQSASPKRVYQVLVFEERNAGNS